MERLKPSTPEDLAEALSWAAASGTSIDLGGAFTKRRMAPAAPESGVRISTEALRGIVEYEPRDLTVSVRAGTPFAALHQQLARDGLMLPLDPPFFDRTTAGGVVATGVCGPRRRLHGAPRDAVIGMEFCTIDGKLVHTGGMVVKNAAGIDMARLMTGSFGTLAAIAVVNFRLAPIPTLSRTFVLHFDTAGAAIEARDTVLRSYLQPAALDLLDPAAARSLGFSGFTMLVQAGGNDAVIARYSRELPGAEVLDGARESALWESVREFTPAFLSRNPEGAVVRVSATIDSLGELFAALRTPLLARAGSGVVYAYFEGCGEACQWVSSAAEKGWRAVVEYVPESGCTGDRWPRRAREFAVMEKLKHMFDPRGLLNRGKLYGRL